LERFVHEQNLTRYIDLLESAAYPAEVGQLQKLLIEEEDRFGSLEQRIDQADDLISRGLANLRRQQELVARLHEDGHDTAKAETVMRAMHQMIEVMGRYRRSLADRANGLMI
jgi:hypothetical protein